MKLLVSNQHSRLAYASLLLATMLMLVIVLAVPAPLHATSMMDFENGVDGSPVVSSITNVSFGGDTPWMYGNAANPQYAIPPHTVNGMGFTWVGETAGAGRITFVEPTGVRFAASFSTADALMVEAFDASGHSLAKRTIGPNLGRLDRIVLEASAPPLMAYVVVSARPGRWLMDDIEAESAVTVTPDPQPERSRPPAQLTLTQRSNPSLGVVPGSSFGLTLIATNRGQGTARTALVRLPMNLDTVQLLDAQFSRPMAWVRSVAPGEVVIDLGGIGRNEIVTTTLRLRVASKVNIDTELGTPATLHWTDSMGGDSVTSNRLPLHVTVGSQDTSTLPLEVMRSQGTGQVFTVSSNYVHPFEPVALWYDTPDGESFAAGTYQANSEGQLRALIEITSTARGRYSMIARGLWSGLDATTPFAVP